MDIKQIESALEKGKKVWVLFPYFNTHLRHKVVSARIDEGFLMVTYDHNGKERETHVGFSNIEIEKF